VWGRKISMITNGITKQVNRPHRPRNCCRKTKRYHSDRVLIYSLHAMPHMTIRHENSTGRKLLTTDGGPTGRNSEEILHQPTNSTETARRYHTELTYDHRHHDKHRQKLKVGGPHTYYGEKRMPNQFTCTDKIKFKLKIAKLIHH